MATKPETLFSRRLHRNLDEAIYREKTNNPFRGGIVDWYYEATFPNILWAEHKFWKSVPREITPESIVSPLQWLWIHRAHNNKVPIVTIVGYKKGGVIIKPDDKPMSGSQFKDRVIPVADLTLWIEGQLIENKLVDSKRGRTRNHNNRRSS